MRGARAAPSGRELGGRMGMYEGEGGGGLEVGRRGREGDVAVGT